MATTVWVKVYLKEQLDHNQATRKIEEALAALMTKAVVMRPNEEREHEVVPTS